MEARRCGSNPSRQLHAWSPEELSFLSSAEGFTAYVDWEAVQAFEQKHPDVGRWTAAHTQDWLRKLCPGLADAYFLRGGEVRGAELLRMEAGELVERGLSQPALARNVHAKLRHLRATYYRWLLNQGQRQEASELMPSPSRSMRSPSSTSSSSSSSSSSALPSSSRPPSASSLPPLRILCLDGGGIRGLLEVVLLMELEKQTGKRIHELFDLICGTSTGALIALAIGAGREVSGAGGRTVRERLSLQEVKEVYETMGDCVFRKAKLWSPSTYHEPVLRFFRRLWTSGGYDPAHLEGKLKELFGEGTPLLVEEDQEQQEEEEGKGAAPRREGCKVFAVAASSLRRTAFLLRSWPDERDARRQGGRGRGAVLQEGTNQGALWEAGRATSAAPAYFSAYQHPCGQVSSAALAKGSG